jgi:two-component system, NarL family, sensor histidine kinase FusK
MGKGLWTREWVRHIAVAVGYGLAVVLFRKLSISEWVILAGLRLTALLLVPCRYWPALIIGEAGYYVHQAIGCLDNWGLTWSVCSAIPPIVYIAPFMYWVRKRWDFIEPNAIHMGRLLGSALLVSVIATLHSLSLFTVMKNLPAGYTTDYQAFASDYFLGNYLGILTITPLTLFIYQMARGLSWRQLGQIVANSQLLFETVCLGGPLLAFLLWLGVTASPYSEVRQVVQIAMFVPVVWLALRHGWQGAAVSGAAASCAVMILMPANHDYDTFRAEAIVAFAISSMLLLGARIAVLDRSASQERTDFRMALALAQRNVYVGEMQLRMTSQALDQIRETVQASFTLMMGRLRLLQPAVDDRGYQRHALLAQDQLSRLAEGLYPIALRERSLPNALRDGALAQMLGEAGVTYACELRGPVSKLSNMLRMTIYRVIWEAVADACLKRDISGVRVRVRGIEGRVRRGVVVTIYGHADAVNATHAHREEMLSNVVRASSGLGLQAIKDRAAIFEGRVATRVLSAGFCMRIAMLDPLEPGGE